MDARVVAVVLASAWLPAADARADDVQACTTAHEQAQVVRRQGKLAAARRELLVCASGGCPDLVQEDCSRMLEELEKSQPTVVIEALDAHGRETATVTVTVDGTRVADRLDGRAQPLDPGEHTFRIEAESGKVIEEKIVLREGEKNRPVRADFSTLEPRTPAPIAPRPPAPARKGEAPGPASTLGFPASAWMLGGLGLMGVGSFAAFGTMGKSEQSVLEKKCAPTCAKGRADIMYQDYAIADISLGVGVIALASAAIIVLVQPKPARAARWSPAGVAF